MAREKNSKLPKITEDRRQSKEGNVETAQHIHNQITDVSSTINALQKYQS